MDKTTIKPLKNLLPELKELLENNFIMEDGKYRRPLSEAEREETEQNREKDLERAYQRIVEQARTQKSKIKHVRREALLYGFSKAYREERYEDIIEIADKLDRRIIESSDEISMFVGIARIKTEGKKKTIDDYVR